jgi:hypothetical protein
MDKHPHEVKTAAKAPVVKIPEIKKPEVKISQFVKVE